MLELPPGVFQQAVSVLETIASKTAIASKTEDRMMHAQREKAQRDYLWAFEAARLLS